MNRNCPKVDRVSGLKQPAFANTFAASSAEAKVVYLKEQPHNEIRFSAKVTLKNEVSGNIQVFQIVGVDEADVAQGKISFISPLARTLTNKKAGDKITLKRERGDNIFEIMDLTYR